MLRDLLVGRVDAGLVVGAFNSQLCLIARLLIHPLKKLRFLSRHHGLLPLGEGTRLRIDERVSEDSFLLFQFRGDLKPGCSVTVGVTEGVFVKGEGEWTLAVRIQSVLIFLQLLDEAGLDFQFWSARIQILQSLDHRPAVLAHEVARKHARRSRLPLD